MQFNLGFKPAVSSTKITHSDGVLMIGSCFSEHIGKRLTDLKFDVNTNPFGIVFNPESIAKLLLKIHDKKYYKSDTTEIFRAKDNWVTFDAHGSVNSNMKPILQDKLNMKISYWNSLLKKAKYLVFTFGSAYAYKHIQQNITVANCHKLPQSEFTKVLLNPSDIVHQYHVLIEILKHANPQLKYIFTVSPVKHLRDGVVENSLSKAVLIQATHQIVNENSNCFYFPAYELVNDDLRDYRFYEPDMAHPNKLAVDYVWQKFSQTWFDEKTVILNEQIDQINKAFEHKIFQPKSQSSIKFKNDFYSKTKTLQENYSNLNFDKELKYFSDL